MNSANILKVGNLLKNIRYISFSIKKAPKEKIKYSSTINLPKTRFQNYLSPAERREVQQKLVETTFAKAYRHQELNNKEPTFVLHDGPPYANGDLHMGHAVNKILKDITLRKHVTSGRKVHYVPGWDCHGLPIELKAFSKQSSLDSDLDPNQLRKTCRHFALDAMRRQKNDFESWGILSDWRNYNTYVTVDPKFIINEINIFYELYKKKLVFRDLKPVFWSPSSRTALAESELEYDENFVSPSLYVRFPVNVSAQFFNPEDLHKKVYAVVWTTTPWTLPANQAICYNNNFEYALYKITHPDGTVAEDELYLMAKNMKESFESSTFFKCELVRHVKAIVLSQFTYKHPTCFTDPLPFLESSHVTDSKGTGLVHTAPAHGLDDFLVCLKNNIPLVNLVNEKGEYNEKAPKKLVGKNVLTEVNNIIMEMMNFNILHKDKIVHSYPIDWRTKQPVILRASEQWFINTSSLKDKALEEIKKIEIYPRTNAEASKKALATQVAKRPYWCISRQRIWGVPIPVFYFKQSGEQLLYKEIIQRICKLIEAEGNVDFWWSKSVEEILGPDLIKYLNLNVDNIVKGQDIFDIWFDSGSTWSAVLPKEKVADLYLEGYDQFSGWFQSSLLISIALRDCSPYKALFVHGFTVDKDGHKMSKSLGNVISPSEIIQKHGVDTLRWWVASHATQNMAIAVSDQLIQQSSDNLRKVRSILRFMNGVIGLKMNDVPLSPVTSHRRNHLNKYLLSHLVDLDYQITEFYDLYEYNRVISSLLGFIVNQVSACYIHLIKDRLYCGNEREIACIKFTLSKCYEIICKALWPITPFLVEESWQHYDPEKPFHEHLVTIDDCWKNDEIVNTVNTALKVKHIINKKADNANTWQLAVNIKCNDENELHLLRNLQPSKGSYDFDSELSEILQVGSATLNYSPLENEGNNSFDIYLVSLSDSTLCPRCRRFAITKDIEQTCKRCFTVMQQNSQEAF